MSFKYKKKMIACNIAIIFFVILDRFFKFLAINGYLKNSARIIGDYFKLNFVSNFNIAFSLPISGWGLNLVISIIILALLYYLVALYKKRAFRLIFYLTFIIFGAISNLFDRIKYGFVIDYLDLKYFTVFNLADAMIVGGVIGALYYLYYKKTKQTNKLFH